MQKLSMLKHFSSMLLLTLVLAFSACSKDATDTNSQLTASETSDTNTASSEFDTAYAAADALRLQAARLEYEWRDTEKFLLDAKNEFAAGNKDAAMQLLNKAHQQAELAIAQAKAEATAWTSSVPK